MQILIFWVRKLHKPGLILAAIGAILGIYFWLFVSVPGLAAIFFVLAAGTVAAASDKFKQNNEEEGT